MQPTVALRPVAQPAPAGGLPVSSLRLSRSAGWPVGQAEAELTGAVEPPAPGAAVSITAASGRDGAPAPIFTGRVLQVTRTARGSRLVLEEATGPLTRLRVDKTFTSATASVVIQDLAGQAEVAAQVQGAGAQLPFYAVLASRSAMDHIVELAFLSGFRLSTTADGMLKAVPAAAPAVPATQAFSPSAGPVIGQAAAALDGDPPSPKFTGDGAYTKQGAGAESWVLQDVSAIEAGDGPEHCALPALKAPADVKTAQSGWQKRLAEAAQERQLVLMGPPPGDLGDAIALQEFAEGNGQARIAAIDLLWHSELGLQTRLTLHGLA